MFAFMRTNFHGLPLIFLTTLCMGMYLNEFIFIKKIDNDQISWFITDAYLWMNGTHKNWTYLKYEKWTIVFYFTIYSYSTEKKPKSFEHVSNIFLSFKRSINISFSHLVRYLELLLLYLSRECTFICIILNYQ